MKENREGENRTASAPKSRPDEPIDDGRTISPMTAEWMPWNTGRTAPARTDKRKKREDARSDRPGEALTREEKRAMLRGAFLAHLPIIGGLALMAVVLFGLACLWLMPG